MLKEMLWELLVQLYQGKRRLDADIFLIVRILNVLSFIQQKIVNSFQRAQMVIDAFIYILKLNANLERSVQGRIVAINTLKEEDNFKVAKWA